jgi:hypothetical protein
MQEAARKNMARQMALTQTNRNSLPELYSQEDEGTNAIGQVRYFWGSSASFVATEFDGEDTFFGYISGVQESGWTYMSLSEMWSTHGRFMGTERDYHFTPTAIANLQ